MSQDVDSCIGLPSTFRKPEMTIKSRRAWEFPGMGAKNRGILAAVPFLSRGRTVASRARSSGRPFQARGESLDGSCRGAGLECTQVDCSEALARLERAELTGCGVRAWPGRTYWNICSTYTIESNNICARCTCHLVNLPRPRF
jgi:hypothetical protein